MTRKVEATISENTDINDAYRIVTGRQREWKDLNISSFYLISNEMKSLKEEEALQMIANLRVLAELVKDQVVNYSSEDKDYLKLMDSFYGELIAFLAGIDLDRRLFLEKVRNFR